MPGTFSRNQAALLSKYIWRCSRLRREIRPRLQSGCEPSSNAWPRKVSAGAVVPTIGEAMNAFASQGLCGLRATSKDALGDVARIGGGHAQREIIEDTFIVALIRSGELSRARALLDQRLHRRPSPRDSRWRTAAAV